MIIVDNALLEIEPEEKELIWEALGVYYQFCIKQINNGHIAKEIFEDRIKLADKFFEKAYKPWGRWYH